MNIGSLSIEKNWLLAPMAGITNVPFRRVNRMFGVGLAFTEMISANGLTRGMKKTLRYLDTHPDDTPLGVQIFGAAPAALAEAAKILSDQGADLLDINMGCPVKKVVKTGAGAALLRDLSLMAEIIGAVRRATPLPLTVKVRAGWRRESINVLEAAHIAQDAGADAVIVHPRTADQGFSGRADWSLIKGVKDHLQIPVIGNGDIRNGADALKMLQMTGCDAVMAGRGSLGNPWLFDQIDACLRGVEETLSPSLEQREQVIRHHLDLELTASGETPGLKNFRKHLLWYTKGLKGGALFRQRISTMEDRKLMLDELHNFFLSQGSKPDSSDM
jgi:tRNA-dihydrouridine synthase B